MTGLMMLRTVVLTAAASVLGGTPGPARTLGDFTIARLDGQAIDTATLAKTGKWVLVYVTPRCVSCDRALTSWRVDDPQTMAVQTVVIVGHASPADARALQARTPPLTRAAWYVDTGSVVEQALDAHGAPIILGLNDRSIGWTTQGALPIARSVVVDWLTR